MKNLGELFMEARQFGRVNIFTASNGGYSANIAFDTIAHVNLDAHSGHGCNSPEEALSQAISKAKEIINSLSDLSAKLKMIEAK